MIHLRLDLHAPLHLNRTSHLLIHLNILHPTRAPPIRPVPPDRADHRAPSRPTVRRFLGIRPRAARARDALHVRVEAGEAQEGHEERADGRQARADDGDVELDGGPHHQGQVAGLALGEGEHDHGDTRDRDCANAGGTSLAPPLS